MRTLVHGGTVVTATAATRADVLVDGPTVAGVAPPGTHDWQADRWIDATDRLVVPGGVDIHTHMELPVGGTTSSDTYATGTEAAAWGGTTTIVDYAGQTRGGSLRAGLEEWASRADGNCCIDYGFHLMVTDVNDGTLAEIPSLVADGITTFKLFTAYPGVNYSDDGQILAAMFAVADTGATMMMHAENGIAIDVLRDRAVAHGDSEPIHHLLTRPASLEAEAVARTGVLAAVAACPLVIVHISSADALAAAVAAREGGATVYAETCPQYLALAIEDLPPGFAASTHVCSPPLRWRREGHQERLWDGLGSGAVHVVATDHCPFTSQQKAAGRGDFRRIPNGLGSVEHRLDIVHTGVVAGRLSVQRWVEVCATAPARLAGLYPRKGTIAVGSDADLVVYDPRAIHVLGASNHHMNTDISAYEGLEVTGRTETVLLRGDVILHEGAFVGRRGAGRFLKRGANQLV